MALGLTVVTHINTNLKRDISKCLQSVQDALPVGAKHLVIETDGNYQEFVKLRQDAMNLDDIIVFVDDDDYISKSSLQNCVDALSQVDAGIAFTKEATVYTNNNIKVNIPPKTVSEVCCGPRVIHHMTAYRTKHISSRSKYLISSVKCSPEWIMKVDAALNAGAVHIPEIGYYWVQGEEQNHKSAKYKQLYAAGLFRMQDEFRKWISTDSDIIQWNPSK